VGNQKGNVLHVENTFKRRNSETKARGVGNLSRGALFKILCPVLFTLSFNRPRLPVKKRIPRAAGLRAREPPKATAAPVCFALYVP